MLRIEGIKEENSNNLNINIICTFKKDSNANFKIDIKPLREPDTLRWLYNTSKKVKCEEIVNVLIKEFIKFFPDLKLSTCKDIFELRNCFEKAYNYELDILGYGNNDGYVNLTLRTPYNGKAGGMKKEKMLYFRNLVENPNCIISSEKDILGSKCKWYHYIDGFYGKATYVKVLNGEFEGFYIWIGNHSGSIGPYGKCSGFYSTCQTVAPEAEFAERYGVIFEENLNG